MKRTYLLWLIVAVIAVLGGFFGGLVINSIEQDNFSTSILGPDIDLSGQKTVVINNPKRVVVNQDLKLQELSNNLSMSLVSIFRNTDKEINFLDSYYNLDKAVSSGLALTSDGWVLVSQSSNGELALDLSVNYKKYTAILRGRNNSYEIDKVYLPKKTSPFILVHLVGVSDLPVKDFVAPENLSVGQMFLQQAATNKIAVNYLSDNILGPELRTSEPYNRKLSLSLAPDKALANSFAFDLGGSLVAIVGLDGSWILAHDFYPALKDFLRSGDMASYSLGISYYDLSDFFRKDFNSKNPKRGAYITAITKSSALALAGVKAGDLIVSVDGVELDDSHDLAELLKSHRIGDKLLITYSRDQENKDINIILE